MSKSWPQFTAKIERISKSWPQFKIKLVNKLVNRDLQQGSELVNQGHK